MLLKVTPEKGLVRKVEAVGYLLHAEIGGLQHCLNLKNNMLVDDAFGCSTCHSLHHGREVARTDTQTVGIKRYFPLFGTMLMDKLYIALEQLFLSADAFRLTRQEQTTCLVIDIKQEALDVVAGGNNSRYLGTVPQ